MSFSVNQFYDCRCELGEGLFLSESGSAAWVDINKRNIFWTESGVLMVLATESRPSVIYDMTETEIEFGSDLGICVINKKSGYETLKITRPSAIEAPWRGNDGCKIGDTYYLGFMHDLEPETNPGYVYQYAGGEWKLIDSQIHIPNTFVNLPDGRLLIRDSFSREIYSFDTSFTEDDSHTPGKNLWSRLVDGAPDGGCRVGSLIAIASWDACAIEIFAPDGTHDSTITLPVRRPTNCKFDSVRGKLWVTSAVVGLEPAILEECPMSGGTFVLDFMERAGC